MQSARAEAAGDFYADVFPGESQFLLAVRTLGKDIRFTDAWAGGVEAEIDAAKLALDSLAQILAVDLEFLSTFRAVREQARGDDFDHRTEFLQRDEDGNFDTVTFEFRIEQRPTVSAVNHAWRHVFAAFGTGTTRPGRHLINSKNSLVAKTVGSRAASSLSDGHREVADFTSFPFRHESLWNDRRYRRSLATAGVE